MYTTSYLLALRCLLAGASGIVVCGLFQESRPQLCYQCHPAGFDVENERLYESCIRGIKTELSECVSV